MRIGGRAYIGHDMVNVVKLSKKEAGRESKGGDRKGRTYHKQALSSTSLLCKHRLCTNSELQVVILSIARHTKAYN